TISVMVLSHLIPDSPEAGASHPVPEPASTRAANPR
ncbi:Lrp/AsnC family transcriptional regulator, partial [Streptomyces sp. TRM76130]|nr:Lrp/AsnC family transcriptional regulator [Streptomyces sp. TRM76130]